MGWAAGETSMVLYADDGRIEGRYHIWVQYALPVTWEMFRRVGLRTIQVLLDVPKSYDSLHRVWCMEIMRGYGMGQNTARLIYHYWDRLLCVLKVSRLLGMTYSTSIGVMQGNPESPLIFNIVVD